MLNSRHLVIDFRHDVPSRLTPIPQHLLARETTLGQFLLFRHDDGVVIFVRRLHDNRNNTASARNFVNRMVLLRIDEEGLVGIEIVAIGCNNFHLGLHGSGLISLGMLVPRLTTCIALDGVLDMLVAALYAKRCEILPMAMDLIRNEIV